MGFFESLGKGLLNAAKDQVEYMRKTKEKYETYDDAKLFEIVRAKGYRYDGTQRTMAMRVLKERGYGKQ